MLTPARADGLYGRWVLANALSEGLGLGLTLFLGGLAAQWLQARPGPVTIFGGAMGAVVLGVALEGVLVGRAQAWALRARFRSLSVKDWTFATAMGAGIAWLLGVVPSTAFALLGDEQGAGVAPSEPPVLLQYGLAMLMGLVLGPILGAAQARVLKRHVRGVRRWLWANALAWALGMLVMFVGMDQVPWQGGRFVIVASVFGACCLAGAVVCAVHGWVLVSLQPVARA